MFSAVETYKLPVLYVEKSIISLGHCSVLRMASCTELIHLHSFVIMHTSYFDYNFKHIYTYAYQNYIGINFLAH